jgi:ribosomal RNA-processing protein 12
VCDLLLKLFPLRQPLLSRHAADALAALCAAPGAHVSPGALSELLAAVLACEQLWERRDADITVAAIRLVEEGLRRLAATDPAAATGRLPRAFHALVPQLAAEQETVRYAAGMCLKNVINDCVDEAAVAAALAGGGVGHAAPPLLSVLAALEGSLGPSYQDAWEHCLPGAVVLQPSSARVCDICLIAVSPACLFYTCKGMPNASQHPTNWMVRCLTYSLHLLCHAPCSVRRDD